MTTRPLWGRGREREREAEGEGGEREREKAKEFLPYFVDEACEGMAQSGITNS